MLILFFLCAFRSGTDRFYLRRAEGFDSAGREVFYYFRPKNALSLTAFYFSLYSRKLVFFILCFLPSASVIIYLNSRISDGGFSFDAVCVLLAASTVLFFSGAYYFIRLNGFFFLARYYFASDKYFTLRQLFSFSYECVKDKKMTVLKKRLSFIPWFASCIFLLPVSFVRSHYNRSMAELAYDLMEL